MRQGFSLVECMVYLVLVMMISMCIVQVAVRFTLQSKTSARYVDDIMGLWVVALHIARDLKNGPRHNVTWQGGRGDSNILWKIDERLYGWHMDNSGKLWRQENKALIGVADGIDALTFNTIVVDGLVEGVQLFIRKRAASITLTIPCYEWVFQCN